MDWCLSIPGALLTSSNFPLLQLFLFLTCLYLVCFKISCLLCFCSFLMKHKKKYSFPLSSVDISFFDFLVDFSQWMNQNVHSKSLIKVNESLTFKSNRQYIFNAFLVHIKFSLFFLVVIIKIILPWGEFLSN